MASGADSTRSAASGGDPPLVVAQGSSLASEIVPWAGSVQKILPGAGLSPSLATGADSTRIKAPGGEDLHTWVWGRVQLCLLAPELHGDRDGYFFSNPGVEGGEGTGRVVHQVQ